MNQRKYIKINKLFGKYDNEIDLSNRGIIFIGENGVGKTTIMKILQNLMNFNFSELIKYDFESIELEVFGKNGKILKDTIKYADLLPTDDEIKSLIRDTSYFKDDLEATWDAFKDSFTNEEKINYFSYSDDSLTDEDKIEFFDDFDSDIAFDFCKSGEMYATTNDILENLAEKNEFKTIMRKIIRKEEFNNLYFNDYINKLEYDEKKQHYWINKFDCQSYDTIKMDMEAIIDSIKEFIENRLASNKEINFPNKKSINKIVNIINDNINKPVDILDMTKVYNFNNELLISSQITNELLEWKASLPHCYYLDLKKNVESDVYKDIYAEIEDDEFGCDEEFYDNSKDITELNNTNIIEINSIINHYFYNKQFVFDINIKAIKNYVESKNKEDNVDKESNVDYDITKAKDNFMKYIRPIMLKNSPLDIDWSIYSKNKMPNDFYKTNWQLFQENINPKIKTLQELLHKYMMNKDVEVTPMGLLVKSKDDNRNIPLDSLSSGEKKLLVIFLHCLFNEDVPIIIDEPEISLSIIWQENLLPDLLNKTNIKQVIVATHSSAVISDSSLDKYIIPLPNTIIDKGGNLNE